MVDAAGGSDLATYEVEVRGAIPPAVQELLPALRVCRSPARTVLHRDLSDYGDSAELDALLEEMQAFGLTLTEVRISRRRRSDSGRTPDGSD